MWIDSVVEVMFKVTLEYQITVNKMQVYYKIVLVVLNITALCMHRVLKKVIFQLYVQYGQRFVITSPCAY